jgi:hypothetical protein
MPDLPVADLRVSLAGVYELQPVDEQFLDHCGRRHFADSVEGGVAVNRIQQHLQRLAERRITEVG